MDHKESSVLIAVDSLRSEGRKRDKTKKQKLKSFLFTQAFSDRFTLERDLDLRTVAKVNLQATLLAHVGLQRNFYKTGKDFLSLIVFLPPHDTIRLAIPHPSCLSTKATRPLYSYLIVAEIKVFQSARIGSKPGFFIRNQLLHKPFVGKDPFARHLDVSKGYQ
jgi:hypothetical protein